MDSEEIFAKADQEWADAIREVDRKYDEVDRKYDIEQTSHRRKEDRRFNRNCLLLLLVSIALVVFGQWNREGENTMVDIPKCSCGSTQAGLIFIPNEDRHQCGDCIRKVYADRPTATESVTIIMQSELYGREDFGSYDSWGEAYAAMTRLRKNCEGDSIERIIGFVVNEENEENEDETGDENEENEDETGDENEENEDETGDEHEDNCEMLDR